MKDEKAKGHPRYWDILTAYRKDKFSQVERSELDFYQVALDYQNITAVNDFKKQNKALMLLLQSEDNPRDQLVVVNTQLYHGEAQDYVRQAQALYLLQQSSNFIRNHHL